MGTVWRHSDHHHGQCCAFSVGCFLPWTVRLGWGSLEEVSLSSLDSWSSFLVWRGWEGEVAILHRGSLALNTPPPLLLMQSRISSTVMAHFILSPWDCLQGPLLLSILPYCHPLSSPTVHSYPGFGGLVLIVSMPCILRHGHTRLKLSIVLCFLPDKGTAPGPPQNNGCWGEECMETHPRCADEAWSRTCDP